MGTDRRLPAASLVAPAHVVVTVEAAARWAKRMRGVLREERARGTLLDRGVVEVVEAFERAATFVSERDRANTANVDAPSSGRSLSPGVAATRARVTEQTVRRWCRDLGLGRRVGRFWVIDHDELERFLEERACR